MSDNNGVNQKVLDFSSRNTFQAANFLKIVTENIANKELIKVIADVIEDHQDTGESNNQRLYLKLRRTLEEKGFAGKINSLFDTTTITANNFAQTSTKTTFNRSISLDRYGANNNNNGAVKTSSDGCFVDIIKTLRNSSNKLETFNGKTSFQFDPNFTVTSATTFGSHPLIESYDMKSKSRGVFFYVNIIRFGSSVKDRAMSVREGAEKDRENLITLFREMNYTIFYYEDLSRDEFTNIICQLILSKHLKLTDSFVCCVQTHGDREGNLSVMKFSDGSSLATEQVISFFSNSSCPHLANKPKIFFFPFCRGKVSDKKIVVMKTQTDCSLQLQPMKLPSYNDILICFATVPGYQTHRDPEFGSWYVKQLCMTIAEHAHNMHLEDMLKIVSAKTMEMTDRQGENVVQVASTENRGFNKLLYFNPKMFLQSRPASRT